MNIGLAYDLRQDVSAAEGQPDDALEEYDSLETVEGISAAIQAMGHDVVRLGGGRDFLTGILQRPVDLVFNISEGRGDYRSREAQVPATLEMLGIPYTGSDPGCLSVCLDKPLTKKLASLAGISTPRWHTISCLNELEQIDLKELPYPAFVKPANEGSSKGIRGSSRVETPQQMASAATFLLQSYNQPVMVEEFIDGHEITVGVVGNCPAAVLGVMRVVPRKATAHFVYSIEVKRDWENLVDYECPAELDPGTSRDLTDISLRAFKVLECRDFGRLDFRVTSAGKVYFLEINPLAGLNPRSSDLPIMARKVGWSYERLISEILQAAMDRYPGCGHSSKLR